MFGRNNNPCRYNILLITLLLSKRFGTLSISDRQLYDPSHERKHLFDLNQCYGSLNTHLLKVMIIYTWINAIFIKHQFAKGYNHIHLNQCYGSLSTPLPNVIMYMNDSHKELQLLLKSYNFWFSNNSIIL